jgi:acetyl esterase/lipase
MEASARANGPLTGAVAALLWFRKRAPALGLNPKRIGSSGDEGPPA